MGLNMDIEKRVKDNVAKAEIIGKLIIYKDSDKLKIAYVFDGDIPTSGASTISDEYLTTLQNSVITSIAPSNQPVQACCSNKEVK